MISKKYVLFDLFDTLIFLNSQARLSGIHGAYHALSASANSISIELWTACFETTLNTFSQHSNSSLDEFSMHQVLEQVHSTLGLLAVNIEVLHQAFAKSWIQETELNPQLPAFIKSGTPFSIITNTSSIYILSVCVDRYPEIFNNAEHVFASIEFGKKKPHTDFYKHAALVIGREHADIIVVGDNLQCDYIGPCLIGMQAFLFDRTKNSLIDVIDCFDLQ